MPTSTDNYTKMLETYVKKTHEPIPLDNLEPTSLRQRLKIIRSLNTPSEISLDEINQFAANLQETLVKNYNDLIANKKASQTANPVIMAVQTTHPINHLLSAKSLFVSDIVYANDAYRLVGNNSHRSPENMLCAQKETAGNLTTVHGCKLGNNEVFTSTRRYSPENTPEDKAQLGRIVAKDGVFRAIQQNLNDEQKNDLAMEMAYQFLLNYDPKKGPINISGDTEMAIKLNASFIYYKNSLGAEFDKNFPNFSITLPDGMKPDTTPPEAILKLNASPSARVGLLRTFVHENRASQPITESTHLNLKDEKKNSSVNQEKSIHVNPENELFTLIFDKILKNNELSNDDKQIIIEHKKSIDEATTLPPDERNDEEKIHAIGDVLRLIKKIPSLGKETHALEEYSAHSKEEKQKTDEQIRKINQIYLAESTQLKTHITEARKDVIKELATFTNSLNNAINNNDGIKNIHSESINNMKHNLSSLQDILDNQALPIDKKLNDCKLPLMSIVIELERHKVQNIFKDLKPLMPLFDKKEQQHISHQASLPATNSMPSSSNAIAHGQSLNGLKAKLNEFKTQNTENSIQIPENTRVNLGKCIKKLINEVGNDINLNKSKEHDNLIDSFSMINQNGRKSIQTSELIKINNVFDDLLSKHPNNRQLCNAISAVKKALPQDNIEESQHLEQKRMPL